MKQNRLNNIFWFFIHVISCITSLFVGFRFSRLIVVLLFSPSSSLTSLRTTLPVTGNVGSRVVVGRHGILVRPWPHPDPTEVAKAHVIIEKVQNEQRAQYYGANKETRTVIAVTPTYVRTFQTLHLTGVMHTLMNVRSNVVWIVVEAGGRSNETGALIEKSGLNVIHVGFEEGMPGLWEDRHKLESRMRVRALRVIREKKLDGIVMFADDSNMHSLDLFDEIQNVKWIGAVSVGILAHSGELHEDNSENDEKKPQVPVQGPACNSTNHLVGWHTFNTLPFVERSARYIGDRAVVLPRKVEWAGFVLNSRLVWEDNAEEKPEWVKDFEEVGTDDEDVVSPLSLLTDTSVVEPLGSCGRKVMLWWLRVEARADSKFPARWIIDPPLEITVPAKHTPWPPEIPSSIELITSTTEEDQEKHATKSESRRKRNSRSKRKRAAKVLDEHISTASSGDN